MFSEIDAKLKLLQKWTSSFVRRTTCKGFTDQHGINLETSETNRKKMLHALFDHLDRNNMLWYYVVYFLTVFDLCANFPAFVSVVYRAVCHVSRV